MNQETRAIFKALGNDVRLQIVGMLMSDDEMSCQELRKSFPLSQPTMSHHFSELIDSGVLRVRKEGQNHFYSLNKQLLNEHGIHLEERR